MQKPGTQALGAHLGNERLDQAPQQHASNSPAKDPNTHAAFNALVS